CCLNEYNKRRNIYGVHSFKYALRDLEHKGYAKEQVFELCERLKSLSNPEYDLYHFCEEMEGELLDDIVRF
ncbi:MAG: hypothetical protein HUJ56_10695, partial [Erysipelotrichaceae bacterium]|nr:hypothetical protein [Erysipelotrichaceae bacterium]